MAMNNPYAKYANNKIMTASKEELTLMLYEGALKFCNQAITAIEQKDLMEANRLILRVEAIVKELQTSLNKKYPVSQQLDAMYDYMFRRLVEGNISKDIAVLEEVRDLLRSFRETWREAMKLSKGGQSQE